MAFVIFFLAAWLAVFGFYSMRKSLTVIENAFIFLTIMILSINFSWIVAEELKWVKTSDRGIDYTAIILIRTILIPMLHVVALNAIYRAKTAGGAWLAAFVSIALITGTHWIAYYTEIVEYVRWNLLYDVVYAVAILGAAYVLHKLYRQSMGKEEVV